MKKMDMNLNGLFAENVSVTRTSYKIVYIYSRAKKTV